MRVCMYACMHVCMYVCVCICICIYIYMDFYQEKKNIQKKHTVTVNLSNLNSMKWLSLTVVFKFL